MNEENSVEKIRSYCAQCQSFCPIICHVENGRFVKVTPDQEHPHATPLCPKGLAGPEWVSDPQRLKHPLKRTRPKGESDPGWERISWDEAMETVAQKLIEIRKEYGGHAVVFNRPGPGGSPARDYGEWVVRLGYAFGSPNNLATGHVCQWHRDTGSKYTYGDGNVPEADYENTALLLIWGHNPYTSVRCNVRDIHLARRKGARLVVVDPRRTELAEKADLWLQVRPGTDGALILGLIHLLIKEEMYDDEFVRHWTNAPFLVCEDSGDLLRSEHLGMNLGNLSHFVWDEAANQLVAYDPSLVSNTSKIKPALKGEFTVQFPEGKDVHVKPVFGHLRDLVAPYVPEKVESITGVPTAKIRALSDDLGRIKPASYYTYNGLEQHTNAMQTNRALCILYGLTGNLDRPGGNVFFPSLPGVKKREPSLIPSDVQQKRLGYDKRPLGPAGIPGSSIQAYEVFESILTGDPYQVKALVAFGGNILTANSHSLRGREALARLDFYVQTELFMTPSAELADIVLPASTFYESFHVRLGFPNLLSSRRWIQYRPRVISPLYETRSDMGILFDLACRLGLEAHFWDGDIEKAFNHQLKSLGITLDDLKRSPCGVGIDLRMVYEKYRQSDSPSGAPRGFKTSSRKVEIFSQPFKEYGYDPLPVYREPMVGPESRLDLFEKYPFILTCSKLLPFCHGQHRSVPSLRKMVPHPFVEIHPEAAKELGILGGEWVSLETPEGKIRVTANITDRVSPRTVCIQHGWWQSCPELGLPGYDPFSSEGANANLLYSTRDIDPISGSVPYKAYLCRVGKDSEQKWK